MKSKLLLSALLFIMLTATQCEEDVLGPCEDAYAGTLSDMTGMDGCSWVIVEGGGSELEPINLNEFDIELQDGKAICFKYEIVEDVASICMVGPMIKLTSVSER